ncbi:MAG: hypothetical protein QOE92_2621, partial [Chloroflexota bacterium]|nr:hypothetical protein [Chloroflexota bacterium]
MKDSRRISDYIPDASALVAAALVVAAALAPVSVTVKIEMLAGGALMMSLGWIWTMREHRGSRQADETRAARLVEEKSELERLLDAAINSQIATSVDVDLKRTLRELGQTLNADLAACFMLERDIGMLRPQPGAFGVGPGSLQDYLVSGRDEDPIQRVLTTTKPILKARGGTAVPRMLPKGFAAGAVLLAPMVVEGDTAGILVVAAPDRERFSAKDVELAMATASSCGVALVKERLLTISRQQLKHSTVIKEVALAVNSSLDLPQILHVFLGKARGVVEYDRAAVALFDHGVYRVEAMVDAEGYVRRRALNAEGAIAGSIFARVLDGTIEKRTDLGGDDEFATEGPEEARIGHAFSEVIVPMRSKGEVVGCVAFRAARARAFPSDLHPVLY